jgi:hypothetical protein
MKTLSKMFSDFMAKYTSADAFVVGFMIGRAYGRAGVAGIPEDIRTRIDLPRLNHLADDLAEKFQAATQK